MAAATLAFALTGCHRLDPAGEDAGATTVDAATAGADAASPGVAGGLACRHTGCEAAPDAPGDLPFAATGRRPESHGACGREIARGFYPTREACEAVPWVALPKLILYGGLGTWGQIGLTPAGRLLPSAEAVADRFDEVCARGRSESGMADALVCHADLIGWAPRGAVPGFEPAARAILARHDVPVTLDVRFNESFDMAAIERQVRAIFEGRTAAVSSGFLAERAVGLSLDLELQILAGLRPTATQVNRICNLHRALVAAHGHDPTTVDCFLYEFAIPTMVRDPGALEPYVYPVLMSRADWDNAAAELARDGLAVDPASIKERALTIKERYIDAGAPPYAAAPWYGCMFVEAPYLHPGERDMFSFAEGLERFGYKCGVWSFQ